MFGWVCVSAFTGYSVRNLWQGTFSRASPRHTCLPPVPWLSLFPSLRKALTSSGLGQAVIGSGFEDDLTQATFTVGLRGVVNQAEADKKVRGKCVLNVCVGGGAGTVEPVRGRAWAWVCV